MKKITIIFLLFISACSLTPGIEDARKSSFPNDPFKEALRSGYISMADNKWQAGKHSEAKYYGKKVNMLARGINPEPENPFGRDISEEQLKDLTEARSFLLMAFSRGLTQLMPVQSASSQLKYDCWVEEEEEKKKAKDIKLCKGEFFKAVNSLGRRLAQIDKEIAEKKKKEEEAEAAEKQAQIQKQQQEVLMQQLARQQQLLRQRGVSRRPNRPARGFSGEAGYDHGGSYQMPQPYMIFFDLNKSNLDISDKTLLKKIAREIKLFEPRKVVITGHTDKLGSNSYNYKLAMKRGMKVADFLKDFGIEDDRMDVKVYGENAPMVMTDDNIADARNRYVKIVFMQDDEFYYRDR